MLAIVAPLGRCSSPSTRICFECGRVKRLAVLRPVAFDRLLNADRTFLGRMRLRLDIAKLLAIVSAHDRAATTATPRRPKGAGGEEERADQARRHMTTMHALFRAEVECKMTSVQKDYFRCALGSLSLTIQNCRV